MTYRSKIGFSKIGGIYLGRNTHTGFHQHHAITLIVSLGFPFKIGFKNGNQKSYKAILLQNDVAHKFIGSGNDDELFIHIDPYTEWGLGLRNSKNAFQPIEYETLLPVMDDVKIWISQKESSEVHIERILKTTSILLSQGNKIIKIDYRVLNAIEYLRKHPLQNIKIEYVASVVGLSPSRFAHLFKEETGIAFRKFVRHLKLINSLEAMSHRKRLTNVAYDGGFSDQAHFTRTFKMAFGLLPSFI